MNKTTKFLVFFVIPASLLIFILVIIVPFNRSKPKSLPVPTKESAKIETVRPSVIDEEALSTKKSQEEIAKLSTKLPYSQEFYTSTGDQIRIGILHFSLDPASVLRVTFGGNIDLLANVILGEDSLTTTPPEELRVRPGFAKQLQNFRETAQFAFNYIDQNGADHTKITIDWGSETANNNAQAWLVPSKDFPEVVREGNTYVFKK